MRQFNIEQSIYLILALRSLTCVRVYFGELLIGVRIRFDPWHAFDQESKRMEHM